MIRNEEEARSWCRTTAGEEGFRRLVKFAELLGEENNRQNLVSAASLEEIWRRHIADSLQLILHVPRETGAWLDLGSGGGFPGLIVAAAQPGRPVVLVESRKLRVEWLTAAAQHLDLPRVEVVCSRVETLPGRGVEVISARAFAPLARLLNLSARFSTPETHWLLPKGQSAVQELQQQPSGIRSMFHVEHSLTDPAAGILIGQGVPKLG